jgi:hypothetical protein
MKNLNLLFASLIVFCSNIAFAQVDSIVEVNNFNVDAIGNVYVLKGTEILKLNSKGELLLKDSRRDLGTPTFIDSRDPLRLFVLYKDFAIIRILDNNLSEQSSISLRDIGFIDPKLICGTVDNSIWVFDKTVNRLSKVDVKAQKESISLDLNQLLGKPIPATLMEQSQRWVVLLAGKDVLVFDQYGTYLKTISLDVEPVIFQLEEDDLLAGQGDSFKVYSLTKSLLSTPKTLHLPSDCTKALLREEKLWILKNNTLLFPQ